MKYDNYGRPIYDTVFGNQTTADISLPKMANLGGKGQIPWVRFPFYPTAPFYSTNPNVGTQTRFYGATVLRTDADYTVNSESTRTVQFDIPCRLVAFTGSATYNPGGVLARDGFTGMDPLDSFLFRMEYTTGDKLMTGARLGSTVVGTMENPGEIGGVGYTIDQGASVLLGITPLIADLRIDITLVCLEIRGSSNFSR